MRKQLIILFLVVILTASCAGKSSVGYAPEALMESSAKRPSCRSSSGCPACNLSTSSLESLAESQGNFWVKVPKVKLAGFLALGGLGSAALGYLATWAVILLGRSGIRGFLSYREFRRLRSCPN